MHSRQTLARDLRALGITAGDVVMVHASVRAVGAVAGGPDEIHLALKDVLTVGGTIIMYAGCPRYVDEIGRGNLTLAEESELLEKLPPFDARTARSDRNNGALVELLRTYPGSHVNPHVARFVVWGKHAAHLISSQPWDYAFGHDSALDRFVGLDGKILLLGSDHDNVTFLHYVEHVADITDKIVSQFQVPVLENGAKVWKQMAEFDTSERAHRSWPDHFFEMLVDRYLEASLNGGGLVGDARSHAFSSRGLTDYALPIMKTLATGSPVPNTATIA